MSIRTAAITTTMPTTRAAWPSAPLMRDKVTRYGEIRTEGEKEKLTFAKA